MATATLNAAYDTYIRKSSPSSNFEGADYVVLGQTGTSGQVDRILLKIPLSAIDKKIITSAKLYLYQVYSSYAYTSSISFGIYRIYSGWAPSSVTWANMPSYSSIARETASLSGNSSGWRSFDVKRLIQDIIHNDRTYEGLMIRQLDEVIGNTRKNISTIEAGKRPYLVVGYNEGGFRAKYGDEWRQGQAFVKYNGEWRQGQVFCKYNGEWRQGG